MEDQDSLKLAESFRPRAGLRLEGESAESEFRSPRRITRQFPGGVNRSGCAPDSAIVTRPGSLPCAAGRARFMPLSASHVGES